MVRRPEGDRNAAQGRVAGRCGGQDPVSAEAKVVDAVHFGVDVNDTGRPVVAHAKRTVHVQRQPIVHAVQALEDPHLDATNGLHLSLVSVS